MTDGAGARRALAQARLAKALRVERPFPWQLELLDRMLQGRLPSALDLPTGLGKTAVIAIWLVARAASASVPRRLAYVVDRRAVVDQSTTVAEQLRDLVAADLQFQADLGLSGPLPISTLRGQFLDNREWLADPSAPAIVLGTVDMVGSRLLFGGYAVSRRMRPYHAGLLGADSLVVLDEAHLVPAFERLLEAIARGLRSGPQTLGPALEVAGIVPAMQILPLSATGRTRPDALVLGDADRADAVVLRRLRAAKGIGILPAVPGAALAETLANEAWRCSMERGASGRCIVFCNLRDDARQVQEGLKKLAKRHGKDVDVELFVGGRRVFERQAAAQWLAERGFLAGTEGTATRPTFVVATSAGEVGVDLDADFMVGDLVAWERMVQRLGRVNRRGNGHATIMLVPAQPEKDEEIARLEAVQQVLTSLPTREDGLLDGSPDALAQLKERAQGDSSFAALVAQATTPDVLHPPLTRPLVEAWSMTSLEVHTGRPEVEPWLRGWVRDEAPQTAVILRDHLPIDDEGELLGSGTLEAYREAAEPHLAERLETETFRVVEWLRARVKATHPGHSNAENGDASASHEVESRPCGVAFLASGDVRLVIPEQLDDRFRRERLEGELQGATLLVAARLGGLKDGLLDPEHPVARDLTNADDLAPALSFRMRRTKQDGDQSSSGWRLEARLPVRHDAEGAESEWLVIESSDAESAQSEDGRSVCARRAQALDEHQDWAAADAAGIADRLGLPREYAALLELAARLHDEGKRAARWQRAFRAPESGPALGKTRSRPDLQLLSGYRHELGSVMRAEKDPRVLRFDQPRQDLLLHLIAAHHGNARPLLSTQSAEGPPSRLRGEAESIALRFTRMEQRWGPWGLAWWEALLRAADQRASRRNDEEGARG